MNEGAETLAAPSRLAPLSLPHAPLSPPSLDPFSNFIHMQMHPATRCQYGAQFSVKIESSPAMRGYLQEGRVLRSNESAPFLQSNCGGPQIGGHVESRHSQILNPARAPLSASKCIPNSLHQTSCGIRVSEIRNENAK